MAVTYKGAVPRLSQVEMNNNSTLFAGQKLYFSHTVPQRQWLMQNAQSNGAILMAVDDQADVILFDHAKKNCPPGAFSYKYVEASIRNGVLEDLEAHRITSESRVSRPVGSMKTAAKGGRKPFTDAEDQQLWNWIKPFMDRGGQWKGNEIYKQIEEINPRHTFQSWRDRWIKHTQFQNRQITEVVSYEHVPRASLVLEERQLQQEDGPARSPKRRRLVKDEDDDEVVDRQPLKDAPDYVKPLAVQPRAPASVAATEEESRGSSDDIKSEDRDYLVKIFTQDEARLLFAAAPSILVTDPEMLDHSWTLVAESRKSHTKDEWRKYFELVIVPEYRKRNKVDTDEKWQQYLDELVLQEQQNRADQELAEANNRQMQLSPSSQRTRQHGLDEYDGGIVAVPHQQTIRAPEPNESRRRSHARGADSISQPTSQSQSRSQRSDHSQHVLPDGRMQSELSPMASPSQPKSSALNVVNPQLTGSHVSGTLALVENETSTSAADQSQDDQRFVTQLTGGHSTQSPQKVRDTTTDHNLAVRPPAHGKDKESPLFFPEDSDEDIKQESSDETDNLQLIDEPWRSSQINEHSSDYAPSEAASVVNFEQHPDLSVGWETAPEHAEHVGEGVGVEVESRQIERLEQRTRSYVSGTSPAPELLSQGSNENDVEGPEVRKQKNETDAEEESVYETADMLIPERYHNKRNTQDERLSLLKMPEAGSSNGSSHAYPNPLEQTKPQTGSEKKLTSESDVIGGNEDGDEGEDDEDEINTWLTTQKKLHTTIDPTILDEICIKSLESTSLQLETTTTVVAGLVTSYQKGKHPAMRHLDTYSNNNNMDSKKNKRKSIRSWRNTISQVIAEMMPRDMRGVWTKEDDRRLMGKNERETEMVEQKHGVEAVRLRFEYLEQLYENE